MSAPVNEPQRGGMFIDGNVNYPACRCDQDGRSCEMPCWQRVGITADPCCPGCGPLPAVEA